MGAKVVLEGAPDSNALIFILVKVIMKFQMVDFMIKILNTLVLDFMVVTEFRELYLSKFYLIG